MRIIIDNRASMDTTLAIECVLAALWKGIADTDGSIVVFASGTEVSYRKNKTGHKFVVYREEPQNAE